MLDRSDLDVFRYELLERLDGVERAQKLANSRIRQDLAAIVTTMSLAIGITLIAYGAHAPWWAWIIIVVGQPCLQAYLVHGVQTREEPA